MGGTADVNGTDKSTTFDLKSYKATNSQLTNQIGGRKMIIKYEIACREAGLSEEQTAEIRKFFDAEQKKLNRRRESRKENGVYYLSIEGMQECAEYEEQNTFDIPDLNTNVEEIAMRTWELERLNQLLNELPEEDKEFLLACFAEERGAECVLARQMGVSRDTVRWRKEKLVKMLKEKFL